MGHKPTTWRELIGEALHKRGETWDDVVDIQWGWLPRPVLMKRFTREELEAEEWNTLGEFLRWLRERDPLEDEPLDRVFSCGHGTVEGRPFTMWTHGTVYFVVDYDGQERVSWMPRHPSDDLPVHLGGGGMSDGPRG